MHIHSHTALATMFMCVTGITRYSNSNRVCLAYKRLDDSSVLLLVTKWRVIGFMESEVVRWSGFQLLSSYDVANLMDEDNFVFKGK